MGKNYVACGGTGWKMGWAWGCGGEGVAQVTGLLSGFSRFFMNLRYHINGIWRFSFIKKMRSTSGLYHRITCP